MSVAEDLVEQIFENLGELKDGHLANELLTELHRGAPIGHVRRLLGSSEARLIDIGSWLASELGERGCPLLEDVGPLLRYPSKKARFWSIDCILTCAGSGEGRWIAEAVRLLDDAEGAVRWKAMDFIFRSSRSQLEAGLQYLFADAPESSYAIGLSWLLSLRSESAKVVRDRLGSSNTVERKFAVVAAARVVKPCRELLRFASRMEDRDISEFAKSQIAEESD